MGSNEEIQGCGWKTQLSDRFEPSKRLVYQGPSPTDKNSTDTTEDRDIARCIGAGYEDRGHAGISARI